MSNLNPVKVKGGPLLARLAFVRDHRGEEGVQKVLGRLNDVDRNTCSHIHTGGWYPFELNERLDEAIASEMGMGDDVFLLMGEKSAVHNLNGPHKALLSPGNPHGLLKRTPQIYQMYYDVGSRSYDQAGEKRAILRTFDAPTYSRHDCLTVIGWHRKAIELCGGTKVRVVESQCRAAGAAHCEYVCEWD
jgi:uncharacterized protein (TIGR02265 family)